jgi:hypothetical protein
MQGKRRKKEHETSNISTLVDQLESRWGEGAFRWVHKGKYVGGPQEGESCVLKEFKTGSVYEESFFVADLQTVHKAAELISAFNDGRFVANRKIYLNMPQVWQSIYPDSSGRRKKKLVEPMLEGVFLKFNSNSGYTNGAEVMQALSHFSYHHSHGKYLLCDLQGGHYEDSYILTDPVIMSTDNSKIYGPTDLGSEGIDNFFGRHKCGVFCKNHWRKPVRPQVSQRIPCIAGSSMSTTIGTCKSEAARKTALASIIASNVLASQTRW